MNSNKLLKKLKIHHKELDKEHKQEEKENKIRSFYYSKTGMPYHGINSITTLDENKFEDHFIVCGFLIFYLLVKINFFDRIVPHMKHLLLPLRARSLK